MFVVGSSYLSRVLQKQVLVKLEIAGESSVRDCHEEQERYQRFLTFLLSEHNVDDESVGGCN
jgi:hypothetical protein